MITCPADVDTGNDAGACGATVIWADVVNSDNCPDAEVVSTHNSGDFFPVGSTEVGYTITDAAGNVASCSFMVNINDTEAPVITGCPSAMEVSNDTDACGAVVTWTAPTASDNCSADLTGSHAPGDMFDVGVTTVSYTAADAAGNAATCTFDITVNDTQLPEIACPADVEQGTDAGVCGAIINYEVPVGTDNCEGATTELVAGLASGATFPVGTTEVTYSVTDAAGNVVGCTFSVTISDDEAPAIAGCPADIVQANDAGACAAVITWTEPTASDNCAVTSFEADAVNGDSYPVGTTTVTYTATDEAGNETLCTFDITVNDEEAPMITCPADIVQDTDSGSCDAVVTWDAPVASDNCPEAVVTSSHNPGATFPFGTTEVSYTITDAAGNITSCSFNVTVEDNEAPEAICQDVTIVLNDTGTAVLSVEQVDNGSNDACGLDNIVLNQTDFDCSHVGVDNEVTLTATDVNNNKTSCTAIITVEDNTAPVIASCPEDYTGTALSTGCSGSATWTLPTATDACGIDAVEVTSEGIPLITSGETVFGTFPGGTTNIVYTLSDPSGNSVVCSFSVTIEDTSAPMIMNCPTDMSVEADEDDCAAMVFWTAPSITDNCTGYSTEVSHTPGIFDAGMTTVTYTVTDVSGNTAECSFDITVTDGTAPVIECPSEDITAASDGECNFLIPDLSTIISGADNCDENPTAGQSPAAGTAVTMTTDVTYSLTDAAGNLASCTVTVIVPESMATTTSSVDASCPTSADGAVSVTVTGGTEPYSYEWTGGATTAEVTDLAGGVYFVTVTDANGCEAIASAQIRGTDDVNPVADCENITVELDDSGNATIEAEQLNDDSADDCGTLTFSASQTQFSCADVGTVNVTLTVTDASGNTDECTAIVTVEDEDVSNPAYCGSVFTAELGDNGSVTVNADDFGSVSDNCGTSTVSILGNSTFDCSAIGTQQTVSVIIFNGNGGYTTCEVGINVIDTTAPTAVCEDIEVSLDNAGNAVIDADDIGGNSFDNCDGVSLALDNTTFDCETQGEQTVELTATDAQGLTSVCTAVVTVVDDSVPTPDFCGDLFTLTLGDEGTVELTTADLGPVTDNCGPAAAFFIGVPEYGCGDIGMTHNVTVGILDTAPDNNFTFCQVQVEVVDDILVAAVCENLVLSLEDDGTVTLDGSIMGAGSTDNCEGLIFETDLTDFTCDDIGTEFTVTLTVSNVRGDESDQCTATVSVVDDSVPLPTFCGQPLTLNLEDDGNGNATVTFNPYAEFGILPDNCTMAAPFVFGGNPTFDCNDLEQIHNVTVIITDMDSNLNDEECIVEITVTDTDNLCTTVPGEGSAVGNDGKDEADTAEMRTDAVENHDLTDNNGEVYLSAVTAAPNPFAMQTKVSYRLNVPAQVRISVWTATGQPVTVLTDTVKGSGNHSTFWKPEGAVSEGLYFIKLETEGNQTKFVKVNLLR